MTPAANYLDSYLAELSALPRPAQIELITRLAQQLGLTVATEGLTTVPPAAKFVGAWADDPDADAMEAAIQAVRIWRDKPELDDLSA